MKPTSRASGPLPSPVKSLSEIAAVGNALRGVPGSTGKRRFVRSRNATEGVPYSAHPQIGKAWFDRCLAVFLMLLMPAIASAAKDDVPAKVRQGIEHFEAGRYGAAASAFADAAEADPVDPRITFDRACAHAAQGDATKAVELFQQAALAESVPLSARSHYNLGNVAAGEATRLFGEKPEEAEPATRQQGLKLLAEAVAHYRDCLRLVPEHGDARHNLELIRLWIHRMEEVWKERDRQKPQEQSLLEMVEALLKRQRELRAKGRLLAAAPDSPDRGAATRQLEDPQRLLVEELRPLEENLVEAVRNSPPPGTAGVGSPEAESTQDELRQLVNRIREEMSLAADALKQGDPAKGVEQQTAAVEALDQVYTAVVPFPNLVYKAIETEEELVGRVTPAAKDADEAKTLDHAEAAWDQGFVAGWSEVLPDKARSTMAQLKAAATAPADPSGSGGPGQQKLAEIKKQAAAMVKAMEKAIETGPKVHELTAAAAVHLEKTEASAALPKQEEALRLLKEIFESLPQQTQQQCQNRQNSQQKDQQEGDQGQNEENQPKPDESPKPKEEPLQKPEEQKPDEQKPDEQQEPQKEQQEAQKKPEEASKEEVEAMIRQVRDRQQQRRDLERRLRQGSWRAAPVDKDW